MAETGSVRRREDSDIRGESAGASVRFFFSRWCEKSNRKSSEVQSVLAGDFRRREDSEIREESAGASVRFFPGGAKSLIANRVRFSQCWLEALEARGFRDQGGILPVRMFGFFFSRWCEKSNRKSSEVQSMLEGIWSTYLKEVKTG